MVCFGGDTLWGADSFNRITLWRRRCVTRCLCIKIYGGGTFWCRRLFGGGGFYVGSALLMYVCFSGGAFW